MKVLHLATIDQGGAAIAAIRSCRVLRDRGVDISFLVARRSRSEEWILGSGSKLNTRKVQIRDRWDRWRYRPFRKLKLPLWSPSMIYNRALATQIQEIKPDLVHLHWIAAAFMSPRNLEEISCPIVWTLHDLWSVTGGFHILTEEDTFWRKDQQATVEDSIETRVRKAWAKAIHQKQIEVLCPSRWIYDKAKVSEAMAACSLHHLPNGLDVQCFKNVNHGRLRKELGLPEDKPLLLFAAINALGADFKGFHLLVETMGLLSKLDLGIELVVMGSQRQEKVEFEGFTCHMLGTLSREDLIAKVYSAVDCFVTPSRCDNLPNTVMEALACGTPVVAFEVGGIPDMVSHMKNGYLARLGDTRDLASGIKWVLEHPDPELLKTQSRAKIMKSFVDQQNADHVLRVYEDLLKHQNV